MIFGRRVRGPVGGTGAALVAILSFAALVQGWSYWPGLMTWDAINQYGQAVEGVYDDWHPPAMAWVWHQLRALRPGPMPMFALQIGLYWLGYALLAAGALRHGNRRAAWLLLLPAFMPFPLAIMGAVLKDCLMQGLMLTGVGILILSGPDRRWPARIAGLLPLVLAGLLRFNAFFATLPLILAFLPVDWRRTPLRLGVSTAVTLAALVAVMPLANRAIGADRSGVELSLMIFDLAGVTRYSGENQFPPLAIHDPVTVNAGCYDAEKWDAYSYWSPTPCPISFKPIEAYVDEHDIAPYPAIARAAFSHPIAYARHRLGHFNINSRFLVPDEVQGPAPDHDSPNAWHFAVTPNTGLRAINTLASWTSHSPLGWPIWWMALAAGLLALAPILPSRGIVVPIALSTLLYGLSYLPFSVASELRYHLWTITGTAIAGAFALGDILAGAAVSRRRLWLSLTPALAVGLLCAVARLT